MLPFEFCQQSMSLFLKQKCVLFLMDHNKIIFSLNFKEGGSGLILYLIWSISKDGHNYSENSQSKFISSLTHHFLKGSNNIVSPKHSVNVKRLFLTEQLLYVTHFCSWEAHSLKIKAKTEIVCKIMIKQRRKLKWFMNNVIGNYLPWWLSEKLVERKHTYHWL